LESELALGEPGWISALRLAWVSCRGRCCPGECPVEDDGGGGGEQGGSDGDELNTQIESGTATASANELPSGAMGQFPGYGSGATKCD